jgi:Secretion system C-terminal sorting domain
MKTTLLSIPLIGFLLLTSAAFGQAPKADKAAKADKKTKTETTRVICIVNSDTVISEGDAQSYRWESKSDGKGDANVVIIQTDGEPQDGQVIVHVKGEDDGAHPKGATVVINKEITGGGPGEEPHVRMIKIINGDTVTNEVGGSELSRMMSPADMPQEVILHRLEEGGAQNVTVDVKDLGDGKQMVIVRARKVRIEQLDEAASKELGVDAAKGLQLKDLSYAPNPNQGRFTLSFRTKEQGAIGVRIHSIDGRELYREDLPAGGKQYSREIDLGEVPAGVYLLEVQQGGQKTVRRIVVE